MLILEHSYVSTFTKIIIIHYFDVYRIAYLHIMVKHSIIVVIKIMKVLEIVLSK